MNYELILQRDFYATRNPQPATRNPQPATRNPQPATRNPQPATRNPQPATRNTKKNLMATLGDEYLQSVIKRFKNYKDLGEGTFAQLEDADFHFQPNEASNSIATIIQHLSGNMLSRWTDFLHADGEKSWRNRDSEFETGHQTKAELIDLWNKGWNCLLNALQQLTADDLLKTIHIRTEPLIVIDAINRQLAHYPHHVGQILYAGKIIKGDAWKSLSIEKGKSQEFNQKMMK